MDETPENTNWSGEAGISPEEFRQIVQKANAVMEYKHAEIVRKFGPKLAKEAMKPPFPADIDNETGKIQSE